MVEKNGESTPRTLSTPLKAANGNVKKLPIADIDLGAEAWVIPSGPLL